MVLLPWWFDLLHPNLESSCLRPFRKRQLHPALGLDISNGRFENGYAVAAIVGSEVIPGCGANAGGLHESRGNDNPQGVVTDTDFRIIESEGTVHVCAQDVCTFLDLVLLPDIPQHADQEICTSIYQSLVVHLQTNLDKNSLEMLSP